MILEVQNCTKMEPKRCQNETQIDASIKDEESISLGLSLAPFGTVLVPIVRSKIIKIHVLLHVFVNISVFDED